MRALKNFFLSEKKKSVGVYVCTREKLILIILINKNYFKTLCAFVFH